MRIEVWSKTLITCTSSVLIILLLASYGDSFNLSTTLHTAQQVLHYALHGKTAPVIDQGYPMPYFGVNITQVWYTVRLVVCAFLIGSFIGLLLPLLISQWRTRALKALVETVSIILESIPEPLYVLIVGVIAIVLIERYHMSLAVFDSGAPGLADVPVPALSLGLPSGLYMFRVMLMAALEEGRSDYILTARSKGGSKLRVLVKHIFPNILPIYVRNIPVFVAIILSSEVFAEYFFGYQGATFYLPEWGLGWARQPPLQPYETQLAFTLGLVLVAIWFAFKFISQIWLSLRYPPLIVFSSTSRDSAIQLRWVAIGCILLMTVITLSEFPHLVDSNSPYVWHLMNIKTGESAPWPPSKTFPLGTDTLGRDLLERALTGTWETLVPAIMITILVTTLALCLTTLSIKSRKYATFIQVYGEISSSLPVLLLLILVMHTRNIKSPHQDLQFIAWIIIFEFGRCVIFLYELSNRWFQFGIVDGAISIGRTKVAILFTHFRSWLGLSLLELAFSEFSRVLALMTMLAAFQVYDVEGMVWPTFYHVGSIQVVGNLGNSWFGLIGDATRNFAVVSYPYWLYAPLILLLLTTLGANLVARGLRGKAG